LPQQFRPQAIAHQQSFARERQAPVNEAQQAQRNKLFDRHARERFDAEPGIAGKRLGVDSFQATQSKHQAFARRVFWRQGFAFGNRRLACEHAPQIGRDTTMICPARAANVACRSRTESQIRRSCPIRLIVSAAFSRQRKVRDFVVLETSVGKKFDRLAIHASFDFLVTLHKLTAIEPTIEGRPFFECQSVGRKMFGRQGKGLHQIIAPHLQRFAGRSENQVERDRPHASAAQQFDRVP
jgi:hypothetical protein